jgi:aminoglycoside phosphotransferase (APT) family kinase protein
MGQPDVSSRRRHDRAATQRCVLCPASGKGAALAAEADRWIDGDTAAVERIADISQFATTLAEFLAALQTIDATGGPPPGQHNFFRGGPPAYYDGETREAIATLGSAIDSDAVTDVWEQDLAAQWQGAPVWFHGDVSNGNLLVKDGRLSAVIDFGTSGVGDPACATPATRSRTPR